MPKKKPELKLLVTVADSLMSALRAYWTVMDLDKGPRSTHFWDLRSGAVNRWKADDSWPPHIHYTLVFRRGDNVNDLEYAEKRGKFPPPPEEWNILFETGTFPEYFNEEYDRWMKENIKAIAEIEEREGSEAAWTYIEKNGPPQYLPNSENWPIESAAFELRELIPKAVELFESERLPIDWKPKRFIV